MPASHFWSWWELLEGGVPGSWILLLGTWDDAGDWIDTDNWID